MKPGLAQILGRTIARIVVARASHGPGTQVVLEFEDGSSFEFCGTQFSCAGGIDPPGFSVAAQIEAQRPQSVTAVYRRALPAPTVEPRRRHA